MYKYIYIFQTAFKNASEKEERIEIILVAGSGSGRKVSMDFNRNHGEHVKLTCRRPTETWTSTYEHPPAKAQPTWCWQT